MIIEVLIAAILAIAIVGVVQDPHDTEERTLEVCMICGRLHTVDEEYDDAL